VFVQNEDGGYVPAAIAVVGCAPDSDDRPVEHDLVPLHRELVRARDEVERVVVRECLGDVPAEEKACTARGEAPACDVVGVGPEEVAHGAVVRHFLLAVDRAYLVYARQVRAQAAMHTEHASVDNGAEREVVEDLAAVAPDVRGAVLALAFVVEAVHLRDLPRLVVAPDERDAVWVPHFVREQEEERLDGVEASVHEVAHEEVVGVWTETTDFEELHHVPELAVDVTTNCNWRIDDLDVRLLDQDFSSLQAKLLDLLLCNGLTSQ